MNLKFNFELSHQNIFPEQIDLMMLYPRELLKLIKMRKIVIEYIELPNTYLPDVNNGEFICKLNSVGVDTEPKLSRIWPQDSSGNLEERIYLLVDLNLKSQSGYYKQFIIRPKNWVTLIHIQEFDSLNPQHNKGYYTSSSNGVSPFNCVKIL
jgi:hypothetical protein